MILASVSKFKIVVLRWIILTYMLLMDINDLNFNEKDGSVAI